MKFDVYYLFDPAGSGALARKAELLGEFCKQFSPAWELRFVLDGDIRECFRRGLERDSNLVVAEDGVRFLPRLEEYLQRCIDSVSGSSWDLIYTDLVFADPDEPYRLFPPEAEMVRLNNLQIHYLANVRFHGGGCFVVNKWSKHKVWERLQEPGNAELSADTVLRRLVQRGEIKACILFPFATHQLPAFAERRIVLPDPPVERADPSPRTFDIL